MTNKPARSRRLTSNNNLFDNDRYRHLFIRANSISTVINSFSELIDTLKIDAHIEIIYKDIYTNQYNSFPLVNEALKSQHSPLHIDKDKLFNKSTGQFLPIEIGITNFSINNFPINTCYIFYLKEHEPTFGRIVIIPKTTELSELNISILKYLLPDFSNSFENQLLKHSIKHYYSIGELQAELGQIFASDKLWQDKFHKASEILLKNVPFDSITFSLKRRYISTDFIFDTYRYERISSDELRYISTESYLKMAGLNEKSYFSLRSKINFTGPGLFQGAAFDKLLNQFSLHKISAKLFSARENILFPLYLDKEQHLILSLFSKSDNRFTTDHLWFIGSLTYYIKTLIEKSIAYEELNNVNQRLKAEKRYLESEVQSNFHSHEIIGKSDLIMQAVHKVKLVANTDATVLLTGETGTGKEVFARAIHNSSNRKDKLLIKVNCAALSPSIIESEFFGHEKGSFTGAIERRIGKFELANNSSIFLDEIGELPLEMQAKLLRFLQEKEIERVGGNQTIKLDVRIIAATNRDLEKEVEAGRFRQDLFYRLCVFPINLPALRDRVSDLPLLIKHFVAKYNIKFNKNVDVIAEEIYPILSSYHWPGNVRELEFMIERSVLLISDNMLRISDFNLTTSDVIKTKGLFSNKKWIDIEKEILEQVLLKVNGKIRGKGGAAELLGLKPTTLESKLKKLGVFKYGDAKTV